MLDGRIDTQGTLKDLRARGILDEITRDEAAEARREEEMAKTEVAASPSEEPSITEDALAATQAKKPRKLVEDEKRETGSVKWRIYITYLKAS